MARRIDHLVVAVRDLDAAGEFYRRLGFLVGARNRHPWGTENRLVQFRSSFVELIAVGEDPASIPAHGPRRFSFGAFVRDYAAAREGLAMLVLDSADAEADADAFAKAGIGDFEPFFFERAGRRPDGSQTRVAFTLAFAAEPRAPEAGFFVCEQHHPENFWNPDFQRHPNKATNISGVTLAAAAPEAHAPFLAAFAGAALASRPEGGLRLALSEGGRIDVVRAPQDGTSAARLSGFSVAVPDPDALAGRLSAQAIPFEAGGDRILVGPAAAHGLSIAFELGPDAAA